MKKVLLILCLSALNLLLLANAAKAQRQAVSGTEVTGTFRSYFKGQFKDTANEILIQARGGSKLKVAMSLIYPKMVNGELSANTGEATGEAEISGDTATFIPDYAKDDKTKCIITLKFTKPGVLVVTQKEEGVGCGFGFNVRADGTYKKTSAKKPKFEAN